MLGLSRQSEGCYCNYTPTVGQHFAAWKKSSVKAEGRPRLRAEADMKPSPSCSLPWVVISWLPRLGLALVLIHTSKYIHTFIHTYTHTHIHAAMPWKKGIVEQQQNSYL